MPAGGSLDRDAVHNVSKRGCTRAIVTLVHGTWARSARWTRDDSALCSALRHAAATAGVQIELRAHVWRGSNSVRAREEAARALADRLKSDFKEAPNVLHFLVAHSHGGNIATDVARAEEVAGRLAGIVAMSTPFVSCRRSRIGVPAVVLGTSAGVVITSLFYYLSWRALFWLWNQLGFSFGGDTKFWVSLLMVSVALGGASLAIQVAGEIATGIAAIIGDLQHSVLARFDRALKHPVPMLCLRFGIDEALAALWTSRVLVKPSRVLTVLTSSIGGGGGLLYLVLWPIGITVTLFTVFLDGTFGTDLFTPVSRILMGVQAFAGSLLVISIPPTIVFLSIWAIFGYFLGSLTLGDWGGVVDQLLADFRITATPDGAAATSRVYSPWVLRRGLRHSLVYTDSRALANISEWIVARMSEFSETAEPTLGSNGSKANERRACDEAGRLPKEFSGQGAGIREALEIAQAALDGLDPPVQEGWTARQTHSDES